MLDDCVWKNVFDEADRKILDFGFLVTGLLSVGPLLWIIMSIYWTKLYNDNSYKHIAGFMVMLFARRIGSACEYIPYHFAPESYQNFFKGGYYSIFLRIFLETHEVEWLITNCVERYFVAKYAEKGWRVEMEYYAFFQILSTLMPFLHAATPLLGLGQYGPDFSCTFYTFDVILPECSLERFLATILISRYIRPPLLMFYSLISARKLENQLVNSAESREIKKCTKSVIIMTILALFCWTPLLLIKASAIVSQLIYPHPAVPVSAGFITLALLLDWGLPCLIVPVLFVTDDKIRTEMINMDFTTETDEEDEEIKNRNTKKSKAAIRKTQKEEEAKKKHRRSK